MNERASHEKRSILFQDCGYLEFDLTCWIAGARAVDSIAAPIPDLISFMFRGGFAVTGAERLCLSGHCISTSARGSAALRKGGGFLPVRRSLTAQDAAEPQSSMYGCCFV